jgi:hypothetical protein
LLARRALWAILLVAPGAGAAVAEPIGEHVLRSYWDAERRTIYSDVLRVHDDGLVEERKVVGGTVDGISMIQIAHYGPGVSMVRGPFVPTIGAMEGRLRWQTSCVFVTPDSAGSNDVPGDREIEALAAALDEWSSKTASCSYMRFMLEPAEPLEVGLDGKNTLKFREQTWCRPESEHKPAECYESEASAITTLCYINDARRPDNGAVLDADVEVNSVDYAIAVGCETQCLTSGTGTIADLQNTLTHEYGHVLGLDHTCWDGSPGTAPTTHDGSPAPQCFPEGDLAPEVVAATMYNFQGPRETRKRSVEADDIAGICDTYPLAEDPRLCEPVDVNLENGCGCAAGGGGRGGLLWLLLAGLLMLRRARPPTPPGA